MSNRNADKLRQSIQPQPAPPIQAVDTEAIGAYVIRNLGYPANLFAVQVRRLWEDHYRVNVLVGTDATSVTIRHSYFLVMGSDGTCLSSKPAIIREYALPGAAIQLAKHGADKGNRAMFSCG